MQARFSRAFGKIYNQHYLIRCSRHNDNLVATCGRPGNCLKVWHSKSNGGLLSNEMVVVGGLSWHLKLPYLAVGGDRDIQLFKVSY